MVSRLDPVPRFVSEFGVRGHYEYGYSVTIIDYIECDWQKSLQKELPQKVSKVKSVKILHRRHSVLRGK